MAITVSAATPDAPIRQLEMDAHKSDRFAQYPSHVGKAVYVTGGTSGTGEESVTAFADHGAKVGIVDLGADKQRSRLQGSSRWHA